ncbi:MAG: SusC/RagA family TonB-linked outer membrane protein [Sphingobacterium sp.]|jgi:TonB-linked SusC/RagA family outer membrane protein|nr:SusC/RagA family TonB-linked outer membrane protein [Sphingobacterium sp.]
MEITAYRSIENNQKSSITLLFFVLFVSMGHFAMGQSVTLKMRNASLPEILQQIRRQTKTDLIGDMSLLKQAPPLSIVVNNKDIRFVLQELTAKQSILRFSFHNNTIIFQAKEQSHKQQKTLPSPKANTSVPISGIITDEAGSPLQGVSVRSTDPLAKATSSNAQGVFKINTAPTADLTFRMLGYETHSIHVDGRRQMNIHLKKQNTIIAEVLVNTGYTQRSPESMTGASRIFTRKELEKFNNPNIFSVLQSLDPSFNLAQNIFAGSNPNVIPDITIRGTNNIGEYAVNSPLVILDGFEVSLERLYDIDINRIQNITLLKDVSSTVLYGSRGGNGVIVVETRLPKAGQPTLTYDIRSTTNTVDLSDYHLMDAKEKLAYEKLAGLYDIIPGTVPAGQENVQQTLLDQLYNDRKARVLRGVNTDWLAQPVQHPYSLAHSLRLEGSKNNWRYSLEGNYNDLKGALKGSGRQRAGAALDLTYRRPGRIFIRNNTSYLSTKAYHSPYGLFSAYGKMNPYQPLRDPKGVLIATYTDEELEAIAFNPLYDAQLPNRNDEYSKSVIDNLFVEWNLHPFVTLRSTMMLEYSRTTAYQLASPLHSQFRKNAEDNRGEYVSSNGKGRSYSANLNLTYSRRTGKHTFNASLIGELKAADFKQYTDVFTGFQPDIPLDSLYTGAKNKVNNYNNIVNRLAGILFTGNYTYDQKYMLDLSYRLDGSSKFGANTRYGNFWSLGIGYNLHKEHFFNTSIFQELRLFANTGINGTDAFLANMTLSSYVQSAQNMYFKEIGLGYHNEGNPNLRWPQIRSWSIGSTGRFWNGRGNFSLAYYNKVTHDMISLISVAPSVGLPNNSYFENMGKVRNRGVESAVTLKVFENTAKTCNWYVSIIANRNRGKLVDISEALRQLNSSNLAKDQDGMYKQTVFYEQGKSLRNLKGVRSLGIDPASGREIFLDKNGRITDQWNSSDLTVIGNLEPALFGNLQTALNYKAFTLQAFFNYSLGGDIYNQTLVDRVENNDPRMNTDRVALSDRWQSPGDIATLKDIKNQEKTLLSSRFVQRENTIRLSSMMLNCEVPLQWIKKYHLQRLRINLSANDLFKLSTVRMERGLDYPYARNFTMGLIVQF